MAEPQGMAEAIPHQDRQDFTDIPLPPNAPAWPQNGEHITGALEYNTEGGATRSRPVNLFDTFHHGAIMAQAYQQAEQAYHMTPAAPACAAAAKAGA